MGTKIILTIEEESFWRGLARSAHKQGIDYFDATAFVFDNYKELNKESIT